MKRLITNLQNIWKVEELRKRIILTLGLILTYRVGSYVILPGVKYDALTSTATDQNFLESILSVFSGGGFTNASIMALGIMPYISASIIMQLLGMAVPAVQKMQNEGESGRKQINNYTRLLTIVICALQAPSYLTLYVSNKNAMPDDPSTFWWTQTIMLLIAGSMFAVWLGERITERGIGNGISLLITVGILSRLPGAFFAEFGKSVEAGNLIRLVLEIVMFFVIILVTILIVQGVRRIPLNTAKRVAGTRAMDDVNGARNYLPIKINASGVMPIIFAQAIMFLPATIAQFFPESDFMSEFGRNFADYTSVTYNVILATLIILFTYFYTSLSVPANQMAEDLKKSNAFVPGIAPGEATSAFIDDILSKITLPGAIFLSAIAILPAVAKIFKVSGEFSQFFGGTSLLILVGVILDTLQQVESYLLMKQYDGLMSSGRVRGRRDNVEVNK